MSIRIVLRTFLMMFWFWCCNGVLHAANATKFHISALPLTTPAQKQQGVVGGEGFQQVMSIVYAPSDPDIIYMGSDTSQVWKSSNAGRSWVSINNGYFAQASRSLFVHPRNPNIVFSAGFLGNTYKKAKNKSPHQGIYRTTNGGLLWELVKSAPFFKQDSRGSLFAIDSRTLDEPNITLFSGTYNGDLLISTDSGVSWSKSGFNVGGPIREIVEETSTPGTILVASNIGLHRFDGKISQRIGAGLPTWPRSISVSPDQPGVVYAALGKNGVFKSIDGGENFKRMNLGLVCIGTINDIEVSPGDANFITVTRSGMRQWPCYTHDGGLRWQSAKTINSRGLTSGGGFYFPSPIAMHPTNVLTALTSSNGKATVLITADGGKNWSYSGSGYRGARLRGVLSLSAKRMIFNLTDHGAWLTADGGQTFEPIDIPRKGAKSIGGGAMADDTLVLSIGTYRIKHLFVSYNRGKTWRDLHISGRLRNIMSHSKNSSVFYAEGFRSEDGGQTWQKIQYRIIAMDPSDNDTVYALKSIGKSSQLLISKDRGRSWKAEGEPLAVPVKTINRIEVDPFSSARLYAATGKGLWVLTKHKWHLKGRSQGLLPDHFGSQYIETIVADPVRSGLLFAGKRSPGKGMANGLFYSFDYGETWQQIPGVELSNTSVWSISINPYDGSIYVGTSHGVYKIELQENAE